MAIDYNTYLGKSIEEFLNTSRQHMYSEAKIFKYLFSKRLNKDRGISFIKNIHIVGIKDISGNFDNSSLEFKIWRGGEECYYYLIRSNASYSDPEKIHEIMLESILETPESELGISHSAIIAHDQYIANMKFKGWNYTLIGKSGNKIYSYHNSAMKNLLPPYAEKVKEVIKKKIDVPDNYFNKHGLLYHFSKATLKKDKEEKKEENKIPGQLEFPFMNYTTFSPGPSI